jgi:hypothetical protein
MSPLTTTAITIDLDVHRALEAHRQDFAEAPNDILRRVLGLKHRAKAPIAQPVESMSPDVRKESRKKLTRKTGVYGFSLLGSHQEHDSLQGAYKHILLALTKRDSAFLPKLGARTTRARKLVARSPADLFLKSKHLADDFADPLIDGWWYDTNLSEEQVVTRLRMACEVAGLSFGRDLTTHFPD